jgi:hypothetical protein
VTDARSTSSCARSSPTTASSNRRAARRPPLGYSRIVRQALTIRVAQAAEKYGNTAPVGTVCCNACRTCVTTNLLTLATGVAMTAFYGVARVGKRLAGRV